MADGTFALSVRPTSRVILRAVWEGKTRSGERVAWTSPEVTVPALAGRSPGRGIGAQTGEAWPVLTCLSRSWPRQTWLRARLSHNENRRPTRRLH